MSTLCGCVALLSNALKASVEPDKRIEIGWIDTSDQHTRPSCPPAAVDQPIFFVRDYGIGIEVRHHEQVFEMFRQLDGHAGDGGGGVGPTIVKKLVERHLGQIWIDSMPGNG